jgi:hypothetical protein
MFFAIYCNDNKKWAEEFNFIGISAKEQILCN